MSKTCHDEFWQNRVNQVGHTGWKNPYVYGFDQEVRKRFLLNEIERNEFPLKEALDFGCGRGEFSRLLHRADFNVRAYDPHVMPTVDPANIDVIRDFRNLRDLEARLDLIVSITVLNHITDDENLRENLHELRDLAHGECKFFMIEKAVEQEPRTTSDYEARRTLEELGDLLRETGWTVRKCNPVPIPFKTDYKPFERYRSDPFILLERVFVKLLGINFCQEILQSMARWRSQKYIPGNVDQFTGPSELKFIICEPV